MPGAGAEDVGVVTLAAAAAVDAVAAEGVVDGAGVGAAPSVVETPLMTKSRLRSR